MSGPSVLGFLKRWWLLLLLGPIVAGVAGYAFVVRVSPVYQADTTLLVTRGSASGTPIDDPNGTESLARTYAEALKTRPVLEEAARRTGQSLTLRELQQAVSTRPVTGTQLLRLSVEARDPSVAAALANSVVAVFSQQNLEMQAGRYASSRQNLEQLVSTLRGEIDSRSAELQQLRSTLASGDPQLTRLESDLAQLQATYSDSVRTYENLRVVEAQGLNGLTVVDPAMPPVDPIRPNRLQTIALALLAGLVVAIGTGMFVEFVDDGLRTRERVAMATNLRALGSIPRWRGANGNQLATQAADPNEQREARRAAEAYRLLFSTLLIAGEGEKQLKSVMVTSAAVEEGKSVTAANLAAVFAESGKRVILVDADVHRPSQMRRFELTNRAGLSTLLLNPNLSVDTVLRDTKVEGLRVLTAGPAPAASSPLYTSPRFTGRLAELRDRCDVLVIDTPPVLAQSDAALIGQHADGVLFVVDARKSRGRPVRRALELLNEAGAQVIGTALNRVPARSMDYVMYQSYAAEKEHEVEGDASTTTAARAAAHGDAR